MLITVTLNQEEWKAIESVCRASSLLVDMFADDHPDAFGDLDSAEHDLAINALRRVNGAVVDQILDRPKTCRVEPGPFQRLSEAIAEGWYIDLDEVAGEFRVMAAELPEEEGSVFPDDETAADHVDGCAAAGSDLHMAAIAYMTAANGMMSAARTLPRSAELHK
jgi:hypothetical protein